MLVELLFVLLLTAALLDCVVESDCAEETVTGAVAVEDVVAVEAVP